MILHSGPKPDRMHDAGPGLVTPLSRIATWRLRLRVAGRAGEAGDGFDLPRRSARMAEGITTKSLARSG